MKILKYLFVMSIVQMSYAATIYPSVPGNIDLSKQYVIYLHGSIIENGDPIPIHPRFGLYDFPAVQQALATKGIVLISEQRKSRTAAAEYANKVKT